MSMLTLLVLGFVACAFSGVESGHNRHHGGAGMWAYHMLMAPENREKMCKAENMKDDKIDLFRTEMKKCELDSCQAEATDVNTLSVKEENLKILRMCSAKYQECNTKRMEAMKKMHHDKDKTDTTEEAKLAREDMKTKWAAKKECIKTAFEKAFGA